MPNPSRLQIEAPVAKPKYKVDINQWNGSEYAGWVPIDDDYIVDVNGVLEITSSDNGIIFSARSIPRVNVITTDDIVSYAWELSKIRVYFSFDTADWVKAYEGVIIDRSRSGRKLTFVVEGWKVYIERTKIYTPVYYRRSIATKTSTTSIEDPIEVGYAAGLMNRIAWESGGRPYEQKDLVYFETDDDFRFWYSFDQSLLAPRWSYLGGTDAWQELEKLIKATGGQLFQSPEGVLTFKQPLSFGLTSGTPFEIDQSDFVSISERVTARDKVALVKCSFIERNLQPNQTVYESDDTFLIYPDEIITKELETDYPVYSYITSGGIIPFADSIKAVFQDSDIVNSSQLVVTNPNLDATRIILTFENTTSEPISVEKIIIQGRPITAGAQGIASYGSGFPEQELETNIYIDNFSNASRLCRIYYDFYNTSRRIITLQGMGYDPDRYLGEIILFSYDEWFISDDLYRIIALRYNNTGSRMDVDIVPIENLPTRDTVFIYNQVYANSDERMVSY